MIWILAVVIWTIVSIAWVYLNLGNKNLVDPWYVWILAFPALTIAYFVGIFIIYSRGK